MTRIELIVEVEHRISELRAINQWLQWECKKDYYNKHRVKEELIQVEAMSSLMRLAIEGDRKIFNILTGGNYGRPNGLHAEAKRPGSNTQDTRTGVNEQDHKQDESKDSK